MRPRCWLPRSRRQLEHNQCHGPFNFFPPCFNLCSPSPPYVCSPESCDFFNFRRFCRRDCFCLSIDFWQLRKSHKHLSGVEGDPCNERHHRRNSFHHVGAFSAPPKSLTDRVPTKIPPSRSEGPL